MIATMRVWNGDDDDNEDQYDDDNQDWHGDAF